MDLVHWILVAHQAREPVDLLAGCERHSAAPDEECRWQAETTARKPVSPAAPHHATVSSVIENFALH